MTIKFYKSTIWKSAYAGMRRMIPRTERVFLPLPVLPSAAANVRLRVEGVVNRAFVNGHALKKNLDIFDIPPEYLVPWENEFCLTGWPASAWLEADGPPLALPVLKNPGNENGLSDIPSRIRSAGRALSSFLVPEGPGTGDLYSFYDPVDKTFRMSRWRWDSGICLEALASLCAAGYGDDFVRESAVRAGRRFVAVQSGHPDCTGGFPEAADLHMTPNSAPSLSEWVVPFNGAFIGAGLLATADIADGPDADDFMNAAVRGDEIMMSRGTTADGLLAGYFHTADGKWRYHGQINDSAIYPRFSHLLARRGWTVNMPRIHAYSRSIVKMIQPEDYLGRARFLPDEPGTAPAGRPLFPEWEKNPDRIPAKIFARGQAWGLLGLNGAWHLTKDDEIVWWITRILSYLLERQNGSGLWRHDLRHETSPLCLKSTAVISWALLEAREAYQVGGGDGNQLMEAVRLAWDALCRNQDRNQDKNQDASLPGMLLDEGEEGAIIYFRNRPMITAYAAAAFILTGLRLHADECCAAGDRP